MYKKVNGIENAIILSFDLFYGCVYSKKIPRNGGLNIVILVPKR
jgi:hypothetical protein